MQRQRFIPSSLALSLFLGAAVLSGDPSIGAAPPPSPSSTEQIAQWRQECQQKTERGEYQQALPACQHVVDALEQTKPDHADFAAALNALGELFYYKSSFNKAEALYRRSLGILEKSLGTNHSEISSILNNLALLYQAQGAYSQAETLYRRSLEICERALGPNHPNVASVLVNMALLYQAQGAYSRAEPLLQHSLEIRERALGPNHPDVAHSLHGLVTFYQSQGAYVKAEALSRRSLEIQEKTHGPNHPGVATSLTHLALLYQAQGAYAQAEPLLRRSLIIREKVDGPFHPEVASSLNNLAMLYLYQGAHSQAEILLRRSLEIRESVFGKNHPLVAQCINNLASLYHYRGEYAQAEPLLRRSLEIRENALGPNHPDIAESLNNLAVAYQSNGAYAQAEPLLRRSLEILQNSLGPNHPEVASHLNNLGELYRSQESYEQALPLLQRSLVIREKSLGVNHPFVAQSLNNMALLYQGKGAYSQAEPLLRRSLNILQNALGPSHPMFARGLNSLALFYQGMGAYVEAAPLYQRSLDILEKAFGPRYPIIATIHNRLASLAVAQDRPASALPLFARGLSIHEHTLRQASTEARVTAWLNELRAEEYRLHSLLRTHPSSAIRSLNLQALLLRKGRAAEAGTWANFAVHRSRLSSVQESLFSDWQSARQQAEFLLYKGPGKVAPEEHQKRLRELLLHAEQLEHQLVAELPILKQLQPPPPEQILSQVAAKLPPDGVLIEFVRFNPYRFKATGNQERWDKPRYLALLLFPDQDIEMVDLGEADSIEPRIVEFLSALQNPQQDPVQPAQRLYQRFFAELHDHLQGIRHLYVSPDGLFNFVPFAALHNGRDYLLGQYQFHYLTTGRDLLREPVIDPKHPPQKPVILADPDFAMAHASVPAAGATAQTNLSSGLYHQFKDIPRLPGARAEASGIERLLGVAPLLDTHATEAAVRQAQAPVILHFATHGRLVQDEQYGARLLARSRGARISIPVDIGPGESKPGGKPDASAMSRSVLLLAGAEHADSAPDSEHDGLFTAEEVRSLDLWGTQLVVLSACDTGRGELASGQGVYGLRRSFLVAGAETLVSSLWPVSDVETGELMVSYYQKLVKEKKSRVGAMEEAMQQMKQRRAHPYYWAPFIVIGQDGPLRGPLNRELAR